MTTPSSTEKTKDNAADDHETVEFNYDHGRMPFFMKIVWLGFLAFAAWYTVVYLLDALGTELS